MSSYCPHVEYFSLNVRPFSLQPDIDHMCWTGTHRRAFAVLEHGLMAASPVTVLTGAPGTGKTALLQTALLDEDREQHVALLSTRLGEGEELLRWCLEAVGGDRPGPGLGYEALYVAFVSAVLDEYAKGRRVVLAIDEAHHLSLRALEELRLLLNINTARDEVLQLVLVGHQSLTATLSKPVMAALTGRIGSMAHLRPLEPREVDMYISSRLQMAEGDPRLIDAGARARIATASRGVPRVVNQITDLALTYAAATELENVSGPLVEELLADGLLPVITDAAPSQPAPPPQTQAAASSVETNR